MSGGGRDAGGLRELTRGARWSATLGVSIAAVALGGLVLAAYMPSMATALATPTPDEAGPNALEELLVQHEASRALAQKRFVQRSPFFMPPPPRPPAPPPVVRETPPPREEPPKGPPPPPATYSGPKKPCGIMGDTVFFDGGSRLRVGEEDLGVKVLAVNPPWSVKLAHAGGEYDVVVTFSQDMTGFFGAPFGDGDSAAALLPGGGSSTLGGAKPSSPSDAAAAAAALAEKSRREREAAELEAARGDAAGQETPTENPEADPESPPEEGESDEEEAADETPAPAPGAPGSPAPPPPSPPGAAGATVPPPLTQDQVSRMDRAATMKALQEITRAKQLPDLDEETKARLTEELKMLGRRLSELRNQ